MPSMQPRCLGDVTVRRESSEGHAFIKENGVHSLARGLDGGCAAAYTVSNYGNITITCLAYFLHRHSNYRLAAYGRLQRCSCLQD